MVMLDTQVSLNSLLVMEGSKSRWAVWRCRSFDRSTNSVEQCMVKMATAAVYHIIMKYQQMMVPTDSFKSQEFTIRERGCLQREREDRLIERPLIKMSREVLKK